MPPWLMLLSVKYYLRPSFVLEIEDCISTLSLKVEVVQHMLHHLTISKYTF